MKQRSAAVKDNVSCLDEAGRLSFFLLTIFNPIMLRRVAGEEWNGNQSIVSGWNQIADATKHLLRTIARAVRLASAHFVIVLVVICLRVPASLATLDAPHNASNTISCETCHDVTSFDPLMLPAMGRSPLDIDDTTANNLCRSCHNNVIAPHVNTHSSLTTDNNYGAWCVECPDCHNPHQQEQNRYNGSTYGQLIRAIIDLADIGYADSAPPKTGKKTVQFTGPTGIHSFADGDTIYNGICEVCHTKTSHFRNDGSGIDQNHGNKQGLNCTFCHPHEQGFKPFFPSHTWLLKSGTMCESCHDPAGTQDIVVDIHQDNCDNCHDLSDGSLRTGTKGDATLHGAVGQGNTSSCTVCHDQVIFPVAVIHHGTVAAPNPYADIGDCEYCHVDPRPDALYWTATAPGDNGAASGKNMPTQMACLECHVLYSGSQMVITRFTRTDYNHYTTDWTKITQHRIPNAAGRINNYGICLSCHNGTTATQVTLWHARPDTHSSSWGFWPDGTRCTGTSAYGGWGPQSYARYTPGRTTGTIGRFNLFSRPYPGFGIPDSANHFHPCSDRADYDTTPLSFIRISIPAVPGNGNTVDTATGNAVPVFLSLTPMSP